MRYPRRIHLSVWSATRRPAVALLLVAATAGCRDGAASLGGSPAEAHANADALLYSLGARFGPVQSAAGYDEVRAKLGKSALVPSRLFADGELWSSSSGQVRELELAGRPGAGGYVLGARGRAPDPRRPGEYRRTVQLRGLDEDEYEWAVADQLAVGPVTGDELGALLGQILRAAEVSDPPAIRAAYRIALPRTTAALGRLFTLDSISATPAARGGTLLTLSTTTHPDRIAGSHPHLSRFLERYGSPARVELVVEDEGGSRWWVAGLDRDRMRLQLRVSDGRLAPLDGPPRPIPDRLVVRGSLSTRFGVFRVGASRVVADVELRREVVEKGFTARFRREPEWEFPPLVERFIRAPLRRPFEGEGAHVTYAARESGGRTTLARDYRLVVQESTILRWLGGLGSSTVGEFRKGAEREADLFNGGVLAALRADALASPPHPPVDH